MIKLLSLLLGWVLDLLFGDPARLPHPIVWIGRAIAFCEHHLNKGASRRLKGAVVAVCLILSVGLITWLIGWSLAAIGSWASVLFGGLVVFYCLAGTTLIREVKAVFEALDRSLDEGRRQVGRIVGRDTSALSAQEVRTAALETLAENLSDGVIAPLFWLLLLGFPGMMAYKTVNTLDSMIGYRTERYRDFGCWAAHIDDVANYLPARLTALLMLLSEVMIAKSTGFFTAIRKPGSSASSPSSFSLRASLKFLRRYGRQHASPNSGYPEAALAAILDCRFGGPHDYFGQRFDKPFIGHNDRQLTTADMRQAVKVNRMAEVLMVLLVASAFGILSF
ncbi:MAG: cobalamin biosynthesis protein CobD [Prevotella sp.]|nr:cobalamin biosynthesis protein CobD [Prevotella sp.]